MGAPSAPPNARDTMSIDIVSTISCRPKMEAFTGGCRLMSAPEQPPLTTMKKSSMPSDVATVQIARIDVPMRSSATVRDVTGPTRVSAIAPKRMRPKAEEKW